MRTFISILDNEVLFYFNNLHLKEKGLNPRNLEFNPYIDYYYVKTIMYILYSDEGLLVVGDIINN